MQAKIQFHKTQSKNYYLKYLVLCLMTENKLSVSILGCGWLGLPLGAELVKRGYDVKGNHTSPERSAELSNYGITPFHFKLDEIHDPDLRFLNSDCLVIAIPPSLIDLPSLCALLEKARKLKLHKIILLSSTGIYLNADQEIDEDMPHLVDTSSKLFAVESAVNENTEQEIFILRLGGLIGYDRNPIKFAQSNSVMKNPDGYINFIHRDDAIELIIQLIQTNRTGTIFNGCCDEHPKRQDFYDQLSQHNGHPKPVFNSKDKTGGKRISNKKVKKTLNFEFRDLMTACLC